MTSKEFRKHDRFDALNLLSYFCVDAENQTVQQGMGRTLNVSETGIEFFGVDADEMKTLRKFIATFIAERAARES